MTRGHIEWLTWTHRAGVLRVGGPRGAPHRFALVIKRRWFRWRTGFLMALSKDVFEPQDWRDVVSVLRDYRFRRYEFERRTAGKVRLRRHTIRERP